MWLHESASQRHKAPCENHPAFSSLASQLFPYYRSDVAKLWAPPFSPLLSASNSSRLIIQTAISNFTMDPISVAASITGLLAVAAKLSSVFQGFVSSTNEAPSLARGVRDVIDDVALVLSQLQPF